MAVNAGQLCYNAAEAACAVCGEEKAKPCARCRLDYYCGKAHQQQDWPRHKKGCGVLELRDDATLGRHLVVTKDVPAGTVLLRELPLLAILPPWTHKVGNFVWMMLCVGCMRQVHNPAQCAKCGWPVCSAKCSLLPVHQPECSVFQRARFRVKLDMVRSDADVMWPALSALRTHLAAEGQPRIKNLQSKYMTVLSAEGKRPLLGGVNDHLVFRCESSAQFRQEQLWPAAARWLREVAGVAWLSEEDLVRAAGINDVNGLLLNALNSRSVSAAFLMSGTSMAEHQCDPTGVLITVDSTARPFEQFVLAARNLAKGEHLSLDYLDSPFLDAVARRAMLRRGWSFVCRCDRCEDPTAGGLHLGSLCCPICSSGDAPHLMVAEVAAWTGASARPVFRCEACGQASAVPATDADDEQLYMLRQRRLPLDETEPLLRGLAFPRGFLPPNHRMLLSARLGGLFVVFVSSIYGMMSGAAAFTAGQLEDCIREVDRLLKILDVVKPGMSYHRYSLLVMKFQFTHTSIQQGGPIGPHRLDILTERRSVLKSLLPMLEPYFFTPEEKVSFLRSYMSRAM